MGLGLLAGGMLPIVSHDFLPLSLTAVMRSGLGTVYVCITNVQLQVYRVHI